MSSTDTQGPTDDDLWSAYGALYGANNKHWAAFKAGAHHVLNLRAAPVPAEPVAWMWQHAETGNIGFIEDGSPEDLAHWERMNKPRKIVAPLYRHPPGIAGTAQSGDKP